jgi:hypothetical protein
MVTPQPQDRGEPASGWEQSRWIRYALLLALVVPAFLPFNYVYRFGVNVPHFDQWDFVPTLVNFYDGKLSFSELIAQHNEHRLLFPRIIMLGLAWLTGYNTVAEMYFNAALLVAMGAALFYAHVRAFGASNRSLLAFLPLPWIIFTFRQTSNLAWGWQIQITLCALCAVISLLLLDGARQLGARFAGAAAAAFVATFSFGSGIALWPAGLLALLWQGRREGRTSWRVVIGWIVVAALSLALYAWNYHSNPDHPDPKTFLKIPVDSLLFMFGALGAVTSDAFHTAAAFGALFLGALGLLLFELRRRRLEPGPTTLSVGLILFAGAAAFLVLIGRVGLGQEYCLQSRYTTLTLLGFAGLHRVVLALHEPARRGLLMGVIAAAAVTTGFWSFTTGIKEGLKTRNDMRTHREHILNYRTAPDLNMWVIFPQVAELRQRAAELERLQQSVFVPKKKP